MNSFDKVFCHARVFLKTGLYDCDVAIKDGKIAKISKLTAQEKSQSAQLIDCQGLTILPGIIDDQVHFRDPGLTHKEDFSSGSRAAALGGITTFLDMPNTSPSTSTIALAQEKLAIAAEKSFVNYGIYIGATKDNIEELKACEKIPGIVGIKIFFGSSTGNLLLNDIDAIRRIFQECHLPIAIHSEDETVLQNNIKIKEMAKSALEHPRWRDVESALSSTLKLVNLARECQRRIHILHITTSEEIELLARHKDLISVEVTPQHLCLSSPECYEKLGTLAQMNPPIREKHHQMALWQGIKNGVVDVLGSDHAPHTLEEKNKGYPNSPSGMPGVQTMLPIMLNFVSQNKLSLFSMVRLLSENPARIFGLHGKGELYVGADADLTIVDLQKKWIITPSQMAYKCGWTPFTGMEIQGMPLFTVVNGEVIMRESEIVGQLKGKAVWNQ